MDTKPTKKFSSDVVISTSPVLYGINNRKSTSAGYTFDHEHNFVANVPYDIVPGPRNKRTGLKELCFKAGTDDYVPSQSYGRIRLTTVGAEFMAMRRRFFGTLRSRLGYYPESEIPMQVVNNTGEVSSMMVNKVKISADEWCSPVPCNGTLVIGKLKLEVFIPAESIMEANREC